MDPASVSAFRLDKYSVTVGRFRQFMSARHFWAASDGSGKHVHLNGGQGLANVSGDGGAPYEPGWSSGWNVDAVSTNSDLTSCGPDTSWTSSPVSDWGELLPMNCVTWYESYLFCIWDGGFLPSEAEWELAAAGGADQREYPWGSADPGSGNQYAIYDYLYYADGGSHIGGQYVWPVGSAALGAGRWGQLDLAGNVEHWVLDTYSGYANFCTDCANVPVDAGNRVVRGGSYADESTTGLSPWIRDFAGASFRDSDVGFRCARTP